MEHLNRPRADLVRVVGDDIVTQDHAHSFKIRYLYDKDFEYDGSRFSDFAKKFIDTDGKATRLAPYLQSWLFFGLMKEVFGHICGIEFDWRDFIQAEEGRDYAVVTTLKLETLIYLWLAREADEPVAEKFERLNQIERVLVAADGVVSKTRHLPLPITAETNLDDPGAPGYPTMAAVLLSIKILGMTLCEALPTVYSNFVPIAGADSEPLFRVDRASTHERLNKVEFPSSYCSDPIVSQLLARAGYCPYQVETCDREYLSQGDLGLRWYFTFLDRRGIPGDHSKCTTEKCVGYQMDESTYETKHLFDRDCDCEFISLSHGFEVNLVLSCVRRGGTPLIRIDWPFFRIFQMGVDDGPTPPYVAISHVWSEGMGNPRENALPRCQLSNLQYSASQSCPDLDNVHFWIDTLCIPVGHEEERKREIKKMASIYSGAEKVVVLDKSLMQTMSNTQRDELLIRIWRSPWASRLWTLQEGRLSKSLSFYFADKFYELEHVGLEMEMYWHKSLYYYTDIPTWVDRYEKSRDPACSRMIELGAKLGDPDSIEAWEKIQKLPSLPLASDRSPNKYLRALHGLWQTLALGLSLDKPVRAPEKPIAHAGEAPPSSFVSRVNQYNKYRFFRVMAYSSLHSFGSLPPPQRYSNNLTPAELFPLLFISLTTRNLTRLEDEAVCLATTLGMDIDAILRESSPEERIRILLTSIGTLPLSILFINSERLRGDNCRWIPRTLLHRGAKAVEGFCQCQPDGRLLYQGPALVSMRPFAINKTGTYFTIEVVNGKRYFIGIEPQPGLDIEDGEKTYLIIPSRPALARNQVPQEVAILSLSPDQGVQSSHSERSEIETQFEFTAWLFDLVLPGAKVLVTGGEAGQYHIWLPPKEHRWQLDAEAVDIIPCDLLTEESKILIG
ncbi:HET domain-containing protein [Fusarium proliferatum]|uniref:HET domain-containing protein n=1 Tax=Gibberella intermedia TaxID=948311 RepID=A0A365N5C5_GIBIN|nr:HET domain-containing protein [Fusarium proliferatum]